MTKRCICGSRLEPRIVASEVRWICTNQWDSREHREATEGERESLAYARELRRGALGG